MKVAVIGCGYVGLVNGVGLANIGHEVTCIDIDKEKIDSLNQNVIPFYEPGLLEMMNNNRERLKYTVDYKNGLKNINIVFVGVGTPNQKNGDVNLKYINNAIDKIMENLDNDCFIVIKSTVPIGTGDLLEKYISNKNFKKLKISVISNPEFLSQGNAVNDFLHASRIVVGVNDVDSEKVMRNLYFPLISSPHNIPFIVMDRRSAEMVKYASNNFLALKISYINEIANMCENLGANIDEVTKGIGYDKRIGNTYLNAGIGYGGSCLPKDTEALWNISKKNSSESKTIKTCIDVNKKQRIILYNKLKKIYVDIKGLTIAVLGLTFKPDTDDLRESPSIENIILLLESGAMVKAYDPICGSKCEQIIKERLNNKHLISNFKYCTDIDNTLSDSSAALIITEHEQIKKYNIDNYSKIMKKAVILDGRNCYSLSQFDGTSIYYESIGRKIKNINCKN